MAKKMLIDATHPEETRVVVVDGNKVEEFDFETVNKRQLAGNIYLAKVTRIEPSLQAAFVDYGGNRHGFLAFAEIHPDYYQIPTADRQALLDAERAAARSDDDEAPAQAGNGSNGSGEGRPQGRSRNGRSRYRSRNSTRAADATVEDAVVTSEIGGMDVVDLGAETGADSLIVETESTPVFVAAEPHVADHDHDHDHASNEPDPADEIESVAEEDVAEEIQVTRRARPKQYKIQEVLKVRQIMLVQVVKEERGNKGAALTTYLSLAGRYCVLMPNTARGGGISRKITNAPDRKKLKEIASEIEVPEGAGLIIRTAGAKRTKPEIKRDYEYLCRLWEQIRELTFKSNAPAPIYEEGDLIKRTIRDLYSREIEEVLVEGAEGFNAARDFMKMIMPSNANAVQHYTDGQPLFARYQVESYLASMFNPVVQLKSGGYIVIGVTEALVAIDVNSGRATKEGSIEETALKTNLEACDEVARQLRLRDLAGLIVIDFIDMEERKNNAAVEKRLKDKLKTDRARIQVGRISGFGLMEMSRQRLRPGMLESTTQPCLHCHGTGLIRSDDSQALAILRALEEEGTRKRSREVLLKAPVAVVNYLFNHKREHIGQIEARYGMAVRMEADPALVSPDYTIEKFKTATRVVASAAPVISHDAAVMPDLEEEIEVEVETVEAVAEAVVTAPVAPVEVEAQPEAETAEATEAVETVEAGEGEGQPKKKRRRRRRRRSGDKAVQDVAEGQDEGSDEDEGEEGDEAEAPAPAEPAVRVIAIETPAAAPVAEPVAAAVVEEAAVEAAPAAPAKPATRSRSRAKPKADVVAEAAAPAEVISAEVAPEAPKAKAPARRTTASRAKAKVEAEAEVAEVTDAPKPKTTRRSPAKAKAADVEVAAAEKPAAPAKAKAPAKPRSTARSKVASAEAPVDAAPAAPVAAPVAAPAPAEAGAEAADDKPRRRGWWSAGR